MRIQTAYIRFQNCWTISSSCDFQAYLQRSQRWRFFNTALQWFKVLLGLPLVLPDFSPALLGTPRLVISAPKCSQTYHNHSHGTPLPVITDPSYSEGRLEFPPMFWHSPAIDASKFTPHILSDTAGVSQWLKYILVMYQLPYIGDLHQISHQLSTMCSCIIFY